MAAENLQEELMEEFTALCCQITQYYRKFLLFSVIDISSISKWQNKPREASLIHHQSKSNNVWTSNRKPRLEVRGKLGSKTLY